MVHAVCLINYHINWLKKAWTRARIFYTIISIAVKRKDPGQNKIEFFSALNLNSLLLTYRWRFRPISLWPESLFARSDKIIKSIILDSCEFHAHAVHRTDLSWFLWKSTEVQVLPNRLLLWLVHVVHNKLPISYGDPGYFRTWGLN